MMSGVSAILSFFLSWIRSIFDLYVFCDVISAFFALWVLDRVFHVFDVIKR